jgi:hypothetical protein
VNRTIAIALDLSPASYKFPLPIKTDHQQFTTIILQQTTNQQSK